MVDIRGFNSNGKITIASSVQKVQVFRRRVRAFGTHATAWIFYKMNLLPQTPLYETVWVSRSFCNRSIEVWTSESGEIGQNVSQVKGKIIQLGGAKNMHKGVATKLVFGISVVSNFYWFY